MIYDRFVFLHMPKTAGIFLRDALEHELGPPKESIWGHPSWDAIPAQAAGLPVLMYVRNPWDWYVSWYHFYPHWIQERRSPDWFRENDPLVRLLLGNSAKFVAGKLQGVSDFATTVKNACENLGSSNSLVQEMLAQRIKRAEAMAMGHDLYTTEFERIAGAGFESRQLTTGRFESLLEDLERFFLDNEIPLGNDLRQRIAAREPLNTHYHRPYRQYYDDDLRDLVGQSCSMLIERFSYRF